MPDKAIGKLTLMPNHQYKPLSLALFGHQKPLFYPKLPKIPLELFEIYTYNHSTTKFPIDHLERMK